jgi:uncharacterized membrane protein
MYEIIFLAFVGILISYYLYSSKKRDRKIQCIIGKDCNKVITSKYSKFLGIENETIGILYYLFVILLVILIKNSSIGHLPAILLIIVSAALLFSLVLTYIQIFRLKEFCEYCLAVALINLIIFLILIL